MDAAYAGEPSPHPMNAFTPSADIRPGSLAAWLVALRPLTLPIAAIPVVAG